MIRKALLTCGGALITTAAVAQPEQTWMAVRMNGAAIGQAHITTTTKAGVVATDQHMTLAFARDGAPLTLDEATHTEEATDGTPLAVEVHSKLNNSESSVSIRRLAAGRYVLRNSSVPDHQPVSFSWPKGALLSEGQRQVLARAGDRSGATYRYLLYDPMSGHTSKLAGKVVGREALALPSGVVTLVHHRQTISVDGVLQAQDVWVNGTGEVMREQTKFLGETVEMEACAGPCPPTANAKVDLFELAQIQSPLPIPWNARRATVTYVIRTDAAEARLPSAAEQEAIQTGSATWRVTVRRDTSPSPTAPSPALRNANAWVQSDDPEIQRLAKSAIGEAGSDSLMRGLAAIASNQITSPGMSTAYASARDAMRSHTGDCTEYALLLAALARARAIPARVVFGLVYLDHYGQQNHVFVPHAWVQAWVKDRWQSYDAALGRFDTTHIALAVGDGTPASMAIWNSLIGQIKIHSVSTE